MIAMNIIKQDLKEAVYTALREVKDGYAQTYLRAIPQAIAEAESLGATENASLRLQLKYVLCNLGTCRGETARRCKAIFKRYSQESAYPMIVASNIDLN